VRRLIKEVTIFFMIFSAWLLYALLSDRWYEPIRMPAELLFFKMAYISVQSYFVIALIRLTHYAIIQGGKE
jgi:hypothetical protein